MLKKAAMTPRHLKTHRPFNPMCDGCVAGKSRNVQHRRKDTRELPKVAGERITCDPIYMKGEHRIAGVEGYTDALPIRDLKSGFTIVYALTDKKTDSIERAIAQRLDGAGFRGAKFWGRIPAPKVLGPDSGPKNCYYNLSPKKITHLYSMLLFS